MKEKTKIKFLKIDKPKLFFEKTYMCMYVYIIYMQLMQARSSANKHYLELNYFCNMKSKTLKFKASLLKKTGA